MSTRTVETGELFHRKAVFTGESSVRIESKVYDLNLTILFTSSCVSSLGLGGRGGGGVCVCVCVVLLLIFNAWSAMQVTSS